MNKSMLMAGVAALAFTASNQAVAQTSDVPAERELKQDVIVVTSRKKEETILEAPVAVSAFDEQSIENLQLQTIDDIARFTPGLSFSKAFGRSTERPVIRGQSNVLAGVQFGVESGTAYFIDGVYYAGSIQNLDPNDLQRVEVIKGPQSALYGRNTYAGAINFITKGGTETVEGEAVLRMGSNETNEVNLALSGPILGDVLTGRVTFRGYEYGGEFRNQVTNELVGSEETISFSGVLDFKPTDAFTARARYQYTEDKDGPLALFLQPAQFNNCQPGYRSLSAWPLSGSGNTNQYYCGIISPQPVALNSGPDADGIPNVIPGVPLTSIYRNFRGVPVLPPFTNGSPYALVDGTAFDGIARQQHIASLVADYDIGDTGFAVKFLGGYRSEDERQGYDSDHSSVSVFNAFLGDEAFFNNTSRDKIEDYSAEIKLLSPQDRRVRGAVGLYYYDQQIEEFDITFADPAGRDRANFQRDRSTENQAIFGLVEVDVTDRITLTVEGRYAEETKTDTSSPDPTASFDAFTPRITLDYDLDNGGTIYGVFAQGVKPGGLNGDVGAQVGQPFYDQEESDNFELGLKTPLDFMPGSFNFTAAGYFTDAKQVQVTSAIGTPTGALTSIATNQGAGEIFGLEFDLSGSLNENWSMGATYAYTDTEFTEGCDADQWTLTSGGGVLENPATTGTDFTAAFPGTGPASCSIVGKRFPLTSEHQASGFVRYDLAEAGPFGSDAFISTDVTFESSKFVQVHNLAETGDSTSVGARAGFEKDRWVLSVYGQNILDDDTIAIATRWLQTPYFTIISPNAAPAGASNGAPRAYFGSLRRGAQFGAELKVRF